MEIGLLTLGDHVPDPHTGQRISQAQRHSNILQYIHLAEPLGFDALLLGEHHFSDFIVSAPQLFLAEVAARTENLRLGTAVTLLAHHDPVQIAEDFATLDVLSGGRAEIMAGRGVEPETYAHYGQDASKSQDMLLEAIDLLRRLWTEEEIHWQGTFRPPLKGVTLQPRPVQTPHPPIWIAPGSLESALRAGKQGLCIAVTPAACGLPMMGEMIASYREAWSAAGHTGRGQVAASAHVYVGDGKEDALEYFKSYHVPFQKWVFSLRTGGDPATLKLPPHTQDFTGPDAVPMAGDPAYIRDRCLAWKERFGLDRLIVQFDHAGQPWEKVMGSLRRFSEHVLGELR
ncbi:MAG: LLM class flavin-dependent oxidoreductase [Myxococcota bacterium]|nr:LLM class flavin-dependent oxidoreductase [Myxococcota bacterium]